MNNKKIIQMYLDYVTSSGRKRGTVVRYRKCLFAFANMIKTEVRFADHNKIIDFKEKPKKPKTALVNTGCFIIPRKDLKLINKYIQEGNNPDALGYFIEWLVKRKDVYGYVFGDPWFDIGSFESYNEANEYYREQRIKVIRDRKSVVNLNGG